MNHDPRTIKPEKVTTPIQLLGAWLAGLLSIDSCFLFAASKMQQGSWESAALTIAAIANVPVFIGAVFLLQTKFRPELQEDLYYSTYLNQKTNEVIKVPKDEAVLTNILKNIDRLEEHLTRLDTPNVKTGGADIENHLIGVNTLLEDHEEILKTLQKNGAIEINEFGTETPTSRRVAFSRRVPKSTVRALLEVATELGFEYYDFYDYEEEGMIPEEVLFGSYGKGGMPIAANVPSTKPENDEERA